MSKVKPRPRPSTTTKLSKKSSKQTWWSWWAVLSARFSQTTVWNQLWILCKSVMNVLEWELTWIRVLHHIENVLIAAGTGIYQGGPERGGWKSEKTDSDPWTTWLLCVWRRLSSGAAHTIRRYTYLTLHYPHIHKPQHAYIRIPHARDLAITINDALA